ncbi:MAG: NUDIX domain-containing protein [Tagaea sp.]
MTEDRPRLIARAVAFENAVWRVNRDHVRDSAGREVRDYVSLSPKAAPDSADGAPAPTQGVAVVARDAQARVALLRNWRHPIGRWSWELPKGFVDANENAEAAARRELAEETRLACPGGLLSLGIAAAEPSTIAGFAALYLARDCAAAVGPRDAELGMGRLAFFDDDAVRALERAGEILDSLTLVGLARARDAD